MRKALELDPQTIEVYNGLAAAYADAGEFDKAKNMLQKALDLFPDYELAKQNLIYLERLESNKKQNQKK